MHACMNACTQYTACGAHRCAHSAAAGRAGGRRCTGQSTRPSSTVTRVPAGNVSPVCGETISIRQSSSAASCAPPHATRKSATYARAPRPSMTATAMDGVDARKFLGVMNGGRMMRSLPMAAAAGLLLQAAAATAFTAPAAWTPLLRSRPGLCSRSQAAGVAGLTAQIKFADAVEEVLVRKWEKKKVSRVVKSWRRMDEDYIHKEFWKEHDTWQVSCVFVLMYWYPWCLLRCSTSYCIVVTHAHAHTNSRVRADSHSHAPACLLLQRVKLVR
jgi:hypothetical protein